jgi:PPOX class probable F420-dependent enzyme
MDARRGVAEARVGRLATIDADGRPSLVPFVFVLDGDTLYSAVDEKPKRSRRLRRVENIEARPDVTVLVDYYEEEWERLWWVRLRGRGRIVRDGPEFKRALALLAQKYGQYRDAPPAGPVIAIDVGEWRSWEGG